MIIRAWKGHASAANLPAYVEHFRRNVVPQLRRIRGFLGALLLREDLPGEVNFLVHTKWASMDAIRAFAGDDVTKTVVEPEAAPVLIDFDRTVRHYEVLEEVCAETR